MAAEANSDKTLAKKKKRADEGNPVVEGGGKRRKNGTNLKLPSEEKPLTAKSLEARENHVVSGAKKAEKGEKKKVGSSGKARTLLEDEGGEAELDGLAEFVPLDADLARSSSAKTQTLKPKQKQKQKRHLSLEGSVDDAVLQQKPNVLYISRIPHGFYEDQMAGFFGQFGHITRLRLSRNKKTGKSKHYAFLEFESPEVAAIVAECMHNYLLFGSILQCKLVPREKIHPLMWVGANRKFRLIPYKKKAREEHNRERGPEEQQKQLENLLKKDKKRKKRLEAAGIDYEYQGLEGLLPPTPSHKKFAD